MVSSRRCVFNAARRIAVVVGLLAVVILPGGVSTALGQGNNDQGNGNAGGGGGR